MEGFECAGPWNPRPQATWFLWCVSVIPLPNREKVIFCSHRGIARSPQTSSYYPYIQRIFQEGVGGLEGATIQLYRMKTFFSLSFNFQETDRFIKTEGTQPAGARAHMQPRTLERGALILIFGRIVLFQEGQWPWRGIVSSLKATSGRIGFNLACSLLPVYSIRKIIRLESWLPEMILSRPRLPLL